MDSTVRELARRQRPPIGLVAVLLMMAALTEASVSRAAVPAISFVNVPAVLPRGTVLGSYSPLVSVQYSGLTPGTYALKVYLLETQTGNFFCASQSADMWCEATFAIDNEGGQNASGRILNARLTNVHDYSGYRWVADLYLGAAKVATAEANAGSTLNRAPQLNPIGNRSVTVGQSVDITLSASDSEADPLAFSAENLPPGSTFDVSTGQFHWVPTTAGTASSIAFAVSQTGSTPLGDAELISIQVGGTSSAGTVVFTRPAYAIGEGGPVLMTATRTGGSTGSISASYATIDGTATSGSDYVGIPSGIVAFADGETEKLVRVSLTNDTIIEGAESFQVALTGTTGGATLGTPSTATVSIVDDDNPAVSGQWGPVANWPSMPIHMHLLPTGKVLFWDRHGHAGEPWDSTPYLWDPAVPTAFTPLALPGWDIFCSGHSLLADGRLLVAGGHIADFVGAVTAGIYDPFLNTWTGLPNMNAGRWYPTSTPLASGDALVVAGTRNGYADINPTPQVLQVATNTWRDLTNATLGPLPVWPDYYPYMFQAPNGKVFVAGPQQMARYLDTSGSGQWTDVAASVMSYRDYGSSVMYDDGKVLIVGGNPRDVNPLIPRNLPASIAEVIDLNAPTPAWRAVPPMAVGRRHLNTTLLPDGKVLVTGGSGAAGHDEPAGGVYFGELWDPQTEQWTPVAAHTRYRGYHSSAMLLPDGRVVVGGGGHPDPPGGTAQNNAEIYSPPYLFKGSRPVVTSAPTAVLYGQAFPVETPDAASITGATWIRLSSVTHAFNENQRINHLNVTRVAGAVVVSAPSSPNLCPPGHYMLFLLNAAGVPSVARIVKIAQPVSPGQELITNGTFSNGLTNWLLYEPPDIVSSVVDGVFQFFRSTPATTPSGQATVFQETRHPVASGVPLIARFDIGNSSKVRKRITVLVNDSDFTDLSVCTFWLAPASPLRTYQMRTHTTRAWSNASVYFYAATAGEEGGRYLVDNVSLTHDPAESASRTDCLDPTAPTSSAAPGPNLLGNADFTTNSLSSWGVFGDITWRIASGVFEFLRSGTPGQPAGVVLQPTGQAVTAGEGLRAHFDLGNSSAVRKRVTVLLHDLDFTDLTACTFWLAPGQALSTHSIHGFTTKPWTNATLSIYAATVGSEQWIRLDNAVLQRVAPSSLGTECTEPVLIPQAAGAVRSASTIAAAPGPPDAPGVSVWRAEASTHGQAVLGSILPIDLRTVTTARLSFVSRLSASASRAEVQVSNDGVNWRTLVAVPPSDQSSAMSVDLSGETGSLIFVRFVFFAVPPSAGGPPDFWLIDQVRIESPVPKVRRPLRR